MKFRIIEVFQNGPTPVQNNTREFHIQIRKLFWWSTITIKEGNIRKNIPFKTKEDAEQYLINKQCIGDGAITKYGSIYEFTRKIYSTI